MPGGSTGVKGPIRLDSPSRFKPSWSFPPGFTQRLIVF
jgi:hypothetical protein